MEKQNDSKKFKDQCNELREKVSEQLVKKINRILYAESPDKLIAGIEPFVAVLRNKIKANNVDAELFFKKHANLVAKMKRMDMRSMNAEVVEQNLKKLQGALGPIKSTENEQGNDNVAEFAIFVEWGIAFCKGAEIDV